MKKIALAIGMAACLAAGKTLDDVKRIANELRNPRKASSTIRTFTNYLNVSGIADLMCNTQVRRPINLRPSV